MSWYGRFEIPQDDANRFAFFLVLAFAAGFSERMVKEVLRSADGDDAPEKPAEGAMPAPEPDGAAPAGPRRGG